MPELKLAIGQFEADRRDKTIGCPLEQGRPGQAWFTFALPTELIESSSPAFVLFLIVFLRVINSLQHLARGKGRIGRELHRPWLLPAELDVAPLFRAMHVDNALRRPDPVVLLRVFYFAVTTFVDLDLPFDAREVDAPLVSFVGRGWPMRILRQRTPGECDLDTPAGVAVPGVVQRPVHEHRGFQSED